MPHRTGRNEQTCKPGKLPYTHGKCMFWDQQCLSSQTIKLYTDASSDIGFAAVFGNKWVAGK